MTGIHRNSQWDFPRKRALFTSDEPDSTTPVSGTQEGHIDRPPDVEYAKRRMTEKRQDKGGTERLGSPHLRLRENLLRRSTDSRRDGRDLRRRQFLDILGSRIGNSTVIFLKPSCVRTAGTISRQPCSFSLIWTEMHSTSLC